MPSAWYLLPPLPPSATWSDLTIEIAQREGDFLSPGSTLSYQVNQEEIPLGYSIRWLVTGNAQIVSERNQAVVQLLAAERCGSFQIRLQVFHAGFRKPIMERTARGQVSMGKPIRLRTRSEPQDLGILAEKPRPRWSTVEIEGKAQIAYRQVFSELKSLEGGQFAITFTYRAEDHCGNRTSCTQTFYYQLEPSDTKTPYASYRPQSGE